MTPNILIVEARFYTHIADVMLDGATAALEAAGAQFQRIAVPGALEIPAAILFAAHAGEGAGKSYDGYVALGCVIRGETYHFEIVSNESARGLMELGLQPWPLHRQRHPDCAKTKSRRWRAPRVTAWTRAATPRARALRSIKCARELGAHR